MLILGLDPGYDRLGWAVGDKKNNKWKNLHYGCIQTNKKQPLLKRYHQLDFKLNDIIRDYHPYQAAVETLFFSKNRKTALAVSEARGVILSCLIRNNLEIYEYGPGQIKQTVTGYGQADKKAVEKMVRMELSLPKEPIIDDAIDALGVMITHGAHYNLGLLTSDQG